MSRTPTFGGWSGRFLKGRDRLQVAIIINQLATPGLGSWMAGYRIAGAGQLLLAFGGFALFTTYLGRMLVDSWRAFELMIEATPPPADGWRWGFILFGVAWLWAGITSLQMWAELRRQRGNRGREPEQQPPRLG